MIIKGDNFNEIILYEYLESTGTLYINTGVKNFNNTINYFIDFQYTNLTGRQLNGTDNGFYVGINNGKWEVDYQNYFGTCDTNRHTIEQKGYITNNVFEKEVYLDNSLIAISQQSLNISTAVKDNINIFGLKNLLYSRERIYSSNIVVDGVLVRDFVPVTYNGVPGLWDKVELKFYGNSGTGDFILGPKKTDTNSIIKRYIGSNEVKKIYIGENLVYSNFQKIEYLESNGSQYIDLQHTINSDTGLFIQAKHNPDLDEYAIGYRENALDTRFLIGHANDGWYFGYGACTYFNRKTSYIDYVVNVSLNYLNSKKAVLYSEGIVNIEIPISSTLSFNPSLNVIRLFGSSGVNGSYSKWSGKIYNIKITQGNLITHDLIPVRNSNNVLGLYDLVSNVFLTNNGSGTFIAGPDIND